ncbi:unnamed protein product [Cuscuta epithymum]|uniref:Two-component response regulator n=1 Tax=Cuscuta epithymum TaxID=186058 RepID=A0AAV0DB78_9ASTE|nr:unnamed protein product [Cuscuta epithymum]
MNLGGGQLGKEMSGTCSNASWKSGDAVSKDFPAGLRVLVVDDDPTCLKILERMLITCLYEVTKCNRAETALSLLRENKNGFDVVISDVHMPDMDGFKLLEHIGLEMDLPVIMMSADDSKSVVMKGVTHGACDYLIKPVRMEALKNIWQHVVRKKKHGLKEKDNPEQSGSADEGGDRQQQKPQDDGDYSSSANEGSWKNSKRRKEEDDEGEERDDTSTLKKPRVVWSVELHQQFVAAVNQLGIDKAVPKKILELMNVPGLTRENVASHLQKYRLYLRRLSGQGGMGHPFMGHQDSPFGPMSSLNGLELQALAASGQISAQSLASYHATKSALSLPLVDHHHQRNNLFSFETPRSRYGEGPQHIMNSNNSSKQIPNLLHGIPTTMEPKQLQNMHQSSSPLTFNGMNIHQNNPVLMQHMTQPQSRPHIVSDPNGSLPPRGILDNSCSALNNSVSHVSHAPSPAVAFSVNQGTELRNHNGGYISSSANTGVKSSRVFSSTSYDMFNDLQHQQPKGSQDWGYDAPQPRHSNVQGILLDASRNAPPINNPMVGPAQFNTLLGGNSVAIKTERAHDASFQNTLFADPYGQDELMSALLKQQDPVGPVESEFGFDGYQLDNLPV